MFCLHLFLLLRVYSNLPLSSANAATFPDKRGQLSYTSHFDIFSGLLTLISILSFLLQLAPFVNLTVDTLAKAKRLTHFYSVALLLEKWFACFPTSGDSLHSVYFSFLHVEQFFCVSYFVIY